MDLMQLIHDQLSGDAIGKLSSLLNADSASTRKAASAAVPSLLAAVTQMASSNEGINKLASVLGGLEPAHADNFVHALGGDSGSLIQKGSGLLSSLFGDGLVGNIASSVGRFANLDPSAIKKLLASLAPMILGTLAGRWKSQGASPSALANLIDDQKQNIAKAIPSGFSLANIPGLSGASEMLHVASDSARAAGQATVNAARRAAGTADNATRSLVSWLLPLAALLLIAFALWSYFRNNLGPAAANAPKNAGEVHTALKPELPPLPDPAAIDKDLNGVFTSATDTLAGIHDEASAAKAVPALTELNGKLDGIRNVIDKLPDSAQLAMGQLIGKQMTGFKEQIAKVLAIPGVSEQLRPALAAVTNKLAALNAPQVTQDATEVLSSLTTTLDSLKDTATAESKAPQLRRIAGKIDELKQIQSSMSPGGQTMLAKAIASLRGPLDQLISKVLAQLGPNAAGIKSILEEIANKITGLAEPPVAA
jgi:hypothetical protein